MKPISTLLNTALSVWALLLCAGDVMGIRVKFGTNDGPIVPPTPEPKVVPVPPFKEPAPVWEDRTDDLPDPNTTWRPLFVPNPLYTHVAFSNQHASPPVPTRGLLPTPGSFLPRPVSTYGPPHQISSQEANIPQASSPSQEPARVAPAQTSAQKFVNAYLPVKQNGNQPQQQQPGQHINTQQGTQLGTQFVPGYGLRYFVPTQYHNSHNYQERRRDEESYQNHIDNNDVDGQKKTDYYDNLLVSEKELQRRRTRHTQEGTHNVIYYQWPVYVSHNSQ